MYSPKELEGEVDHSFFDSDCDVSGAKPGNPIHQEEEDRGCSNEKLSKQAEESRIERKAEECGSTTMGNKETENEPREVDTLEKEMFRLEVQSGLMVKPGSECKEDIEIRKEASSLEKREDPPEQKQNVKKEDSSCGKEDSDASSRKSSPLPRSDLSESSRGSQSDDSSSIYSSSSAAEEDDGVFKTQDDGYRHSETAKKSIGKFHKRSHSHSSSSSSSGERSPTPSAKPSNTQSASSPRRQPRPASANQKQRPKASETVDSDDTVTDVTPLTSPDASPLQSFDLAPPTSSELALPDTLETVDGQQLDVNGDGEERSSVPSAGRQMDRVLLVSSLGSASVSSGKGCAGRRQKNFSFSTDEVRRIECENQRLLRELSRSSTRSSTRSTHRPAAPSFRLYHSALNRQREQQRIQQENLAFLKRLESVKATPGMTRLEQLTDYQRQAEYLGIPTPLIRSASGKNTRTCSSTSPRRTKPGSSKPSRTMAPRPAWS